jgi:hypothetical protein
MVTVKVLEARPVGDYRLELLLSDRSVRVVDLASQLTGPLFGELKDPALFRQVRVIPDFGALEWPNGADLCNDVLLGA